MNALRSSIATLVATISRSPIVVGRRVVRAPVGYDEADIAILEWIAAEGRRIGRIASVM